MNKPLLKLNHKKASSANFKKGCGNADEIKTLFKFYK